MNIIDAVKKMKQGFLMRRKSWKGKSDYATMDDNNDITLCFDDEPIFALGVSEVLAKDWVVYMHKEET